MSIQFACTDCGAKYSVKSELAGKSAKCKCGAKIMIPMAVVPTPAAQKAKPTAAAKPSVSSKMPLTSKSKTASKTLPPLAAPLDDLFDELPALSTKSAAAGSSGKATEKSSIASGLGEGPSKPLKKPASKSYTPGGMFGFGKVISGDGPAILKIGAGAVVGGLIALKSLNRAGRNGDVNVPQGMTIPAVVCVAVVGAGIASLLLVRDAVRKRRDRGQRVPLLLRLYFANGWLSLPLWIITVFGIVFVGVMVLAVTSS